MFAIIFGVLSYTGIFGDRGGVHVIIALVLGLLAVRWPVYTDFLNIISPKLGVGLVVILVLVILTGLFTPEGSRAVLGWILLGVGVVIFLIVLGSTYSDLNVYRYGGGFITSELIGYLVLITLLIGVIIAVVVSNGKSEKKDKVDAIKGLWSK